MNIYLCRYLCLLAAFSVFSASADADKKPLTGNQPVTKLRWLVVHAPNDYFIRMAKVFKEKVEKETDKRVVVELLDESGCFDDLYPDWKSKESVGGRTNYISQLRNLLKKKGLEETKANIMKISSDETFAGGAAVALKRAEGMRLLQEGKVDIAQSYTYFLAKNGNPEYHALELPFLFTGYEHVDRFLESDAGEKLLASTVSDFGYRGLAYTFSGGLLVSLTQKKNPLVSEQSWSGLRFRKIGSTIRERTLAELGGKFVPLSSYKKIAFGSPVGHRPTNLIQANAIDAEEINLPDVERWLSDVIPTPGKKLPPKNRYDLNKFAVTETQHSLLSTIFVIKEQTFQSMSKKDQEIVKAAALVSAKFERELTIQRYEDAKKRLRDVGFTWLTVSPEERKKMRAKVEPVYTQLFKEVPTTKQIVEKALELKELHIKKVADK
ncbi:MAG: hypothetical protein WC635_05160 [Bacteriovorax sp.]|jgi:TRAP-type C4-dicarboxylate transport system substrate-binding protein